MMIKLISYLLVVFFLGIPQVIASGDDLRDLLLNQGYQEISLRLSKNHFLMLDIVLGGKKIPQPFILDTGATKSSIDQSLEEKYQFKRHGKSYLTSGVGSNSFLTHSVMIPYMRLGNFSVTQQLVSLQHFSHIKVDQRPIAGMIGLDFLRKYHAIIDVSHHRMFLKKQPIENNLLKKVLGEMSYECVQLKRSPSGHQVIDVAINGQKPVPFMLDTGIAPFMIASYYEKNIALQNKKNLTTGRGSSGAVMKMFSAKIENVGIGPMRDPLQDVMVTTGIEGAKIGVPIVGFVGLLWMLSHEAVLDVVGDLLFVRYK